MRAMVTLDGARVWLAAVLQGRILFLEGLMGHSLAVPFCNNLQGEVPRRSTPARTETAAPAGGAGC